MSDVDAAIAAGRVPDGITAEYLKQSRDGPAIGAIVFLCILTALVVLSRCASRLFLVKSFGVDDALALVGLALLIAFVALVIVLISLGSGRHYDYIQYIMPLHTVRLTETLDFIAHILYTTALVICRFSGLLFYHRIVSQSRRFANTIRCAAAFLVLSYLPQLLLLILHCTPVTTLWPYAWQPGVDDYTCLAWGVVYVTNSGISLLCDILLFGIPLAIIRFMKISRRRKIGLAMIFFPGLLVVGISIARLILVIQGQWDADQSWTYDPMLAVETSEIGGTLIALSVPGIKPFFDKLFSSRRNTTHASSTFHSGGVGSVPRGLYKAHGNGDFGWTVQGGHGKGEVSKDMADNESTDVILTGVHYHVEEHDVEDIPLKERSATSRPM
ncbi:hypothetical protein H2200_002268 [Cladophialophora chaetospira]|uniref:Rhodopsin domain-containing protein n=1 Tax=Cladophialophora chaetospira TaxID=386627 RepID=A0AA38XIK4_9EURO|nr:hypothetical protein H2200_002268 [Cladophialophora chaetospira]